MKHTAAELAIWQALPLGVKVRMTQERIRAWVNEYGENGVYVSFSGGKDSTVLLHIARDLYPDIKAAFVNTGLEYPEIQRHVRTFDNVDILTPKMGFREVITKYGYPFISKEVSQTIYEIRISEKNGRYDTYRHKKINGEMAESRYNAERWRGLKDVDFIISHVCCDVMKKSPAKKYEKETGRKPILGIMASESFLRTTKWMRNGCNAFDAKRPESTPMAFWTDQDVLQYITENKVKLADVYGEIVATDTDGFEYEQTLCGCASYKTTGCSRTGCIFCGFGAHLETGEGRFKRLKQTHPKQYDYCMGGGAYSEDGIWRPTKDGLGMAHCIDELNRLYGNGFIEY